MPRLEIADLDDLERLDGLPADPKPVPLVLERLFGEAVGNDPGAAQAFEPGGLDDMNARRPVEERGVLCRSPRPSPEARARAIPREPVERQVSCVYRPDERLVAVRGGGDVWLEPGDRRILAHVPERVQPLVRIGRSRLAHGGRIVRAPL